MWWCTPKIQNSQEANAGENEFQDTLDLLRTYLKVKVELGVAFSGNMLAFHAECTRLNVN